MVILEKVSPERILEKKARNLMDKIEEKYPSAEFKTTSIPGSKLKISSWLDYFSIQQVIKISANISVDGEKFFQVDAYELPGGKIIIKDSRNNYVGNC